MENGSLSPRILKLLDGATAKLEAVERQKNEPIAIIGMACRMPGGVMTPEALWQLLSKGVDAITEIPTSRWSIDDFYHSDPEEPGKIYSRFGGFLDSVDKFDAAFFGISPREALNLDPQQRLLLEVAWESLENAGLTRECYNDSSTGVFIGMTTHDYAQLLIDASKHNPIDPYFSTGNTLNAAAGRLSYFLGLQGPSLTVDTACSSSLTAIHLACQSLRNNESSMCLAGASNLILTPEPSIALSRARMLAADGRCKTFDASADGYVRGEGCAVIVLKRLSDAERDGDSILALIRSSAINQGGASGGFTVPSAIAQKTLLKEVLYKAKVLPNEVDYLEAHGTGTSLGDPIEISAAAAAYGKDRRSPLIVGSIKTNIGHLEATSGMAGLMKVILSLHNQSIPPHLHFNQANPHIDWEQLPITVPVNSIPWPRQAKKRLAGVSSFGASGTNVHLLIEEAAELKECSHAIDRSLHVLTLSAKTEAALQQLVNSYVTTVDEILPLANIAYSANSGRNHFNYRVAIIGKDWVELRQKLLSLNSNDCIKGQSKLQPSKVTFLFTGQGSQYIGMGQELYETQPLFRKTVQQCDQLLQPHLGRSIIEIIYSVKSVDTELLQQTAYTQPALFVLEYALAELWRSWGIQPTALLGHSVGEYAAACIAGVFSLEDGLKLIAARGRLMQALPMQAGKMAAVAEDVEQVQAVLSQYHDSVVIAAINGPKNVVISGDSKTINQLMATFSAKGVKVVELNVSHAFHSPLIEPMVDDFRKIAETISYSSPHISIYSNLTGALINEQIADPDYWVRHIRQPVLFADSIAGLAKQNQSLFVEIGPKPVLSALVVACLPEAVCLPSLHIKGSDWQYLLQSLAKLYVQGKEVNWHGFDAGYQRQRINLPNYPWQRQSFWPKKTGEISELSEGLAINEIFDVKTVNRQLAESHQFSEQELGILPKLLEALTDLQQQRNVSRLKHLFYKVSWRPQSLLGLVPDYLLAPTRIGNDLAPLLKEIKKRQDLSEYWAFVEQLECLSVDYILLAFMRMGFSFKADQSFEAKILAEQLAIIPSMQRLFLRLLQILAETRVLKESNGEWHVLSVPMITEPADTLAKLAIQYPQTEIELTMLERCGLGLSNVLTGQCEPLSELLFPEKETITAAHLYQDALAARVMNQLVQQAISAAIAELPNNRKLRILEIGAGTGGTSAYILPALKKLDIEYVYTDVSPVFLNQAKIKFESYSFIDYRLLNIEQSLESQDFQDQYFDLIIAANVVHATCDLQQTVAHCRQLMLPGALLLLLENTGKLRFLDLIFGLTAGWWRFSDSELRLDHPLISTVQWQHLLVDNGFSEVDTLSAETNEATFLAKQAVILARADHVALPAKKQNTWLVFADKQGIAVALQKRLQVSGCRCVLVFPDNSYEQFSPLEFHINPKSTADYQRLFIDMDKAPKHVVYLWGLSTVEEVVEHVYQSCSEALSLVQGLIAHQFTQAPQLCLVSQDSVSVNAGENVTGFAHAPLWGLAKVIELEHPELQTVCLDLAKNYSVSLAADAIKAELYVQNAENQVAVRNDRRYVARLTQYPINTEDLTTTIHADASYLITGGLGGLGLAVADWLISQGAITLVLLGRHSPNTVAEQKISAWRQSGITIKVSLADIGNKNQIAAVLAEIPSLRGIIHAAGTLDDGILMQQTPERFSTVMTAKVNGAWYLHQLTQSLSLDFLVLFSSTVSLLGSAGQSNHAAANAFMDALAYFRRAQDLPAQVLNWGPWSEVGAAAKDNIEAQHKNKGVSSLLPQQGILAMQWAMAQSIIQLGVINMDWHQLPKSMQAWPFFAEVLAMTQQDDIASATAIKAPDEKSKFIEKFHAASTKNQRTLLIELVRSEIAAVLNLANVKDIDTEQGFFELGMDSLVSVEFKNHLQTAVQLSLPATLSFDYPTTEVLVDYLLSIMLSKTVEDVAHNLPEDSTENLNELSEQQLGGMLDDLLNDFEDQE